jgi:hypothetical protein
VNLPAKVRKTPQYKNHCCKKVAYWLQATGYPLSATGFKRTADNLLLIGLQATGYRLQALSG